MSSVIHGYGPTDTRCPSCGDCHGALEGTDDPAVVRYRCWCGSSATGPADQVCWCGTNHAEPLGAAGESAVTGGDVSETCACGHELDEHERGVECAVDDCPCIHFEAGEQAQPS